MSRVYETAVVPAHLSGKGMPMCSWVAEVGRERYEVHYSVASDVAVNRTAALYKLTDRLADVLEMMVKEATAPPPQVGTVEPEPVVPVVPVSPAVPPAPKKSKSATKREAAQKKKAPK